MTPPDVSRLRDFAARLHRSLVQSERRRRRGVLRARRLAQGERQCSRSGREAITETAQGFMTAFPDMQVLMDDIAIEADGVVYRWTLVGTNTGAEGPDVGFASAATRSGGLAPTVSSPNPWVTSTAKTTSVRSEA